MNCGRSDSTYANSWSPTLGDGNVRRADAGGPVERNVRGLPNGENTFNKSKKQIAAQINRVCAICGARVQITVYEGGTYRGGEYFGKMPELAMRKRPGGYDARLAEEIWRHSDEYWECVACARK
jgi:hypothetical protein